jgi:hypothetical protein
LIAPSLGKYDRSSRTPGGGEPSYAEMQVGCYFWVIKSKKKSKVIPVTGHGGL